MSHWNYRAVKVNGELRIYDVYYNDAGDPLSRSERPSHFYGESVESLQEQLQWFIEALNKEVLDDAIFTREDSAGSSLGES
jgi:hypothetical protein